MFVTYKMHFKTSPDPRESGETTFSGVTFWHDELEGLRYANHNGLKLVEIDTDGVRLEDLIRRG